MGFVCQTEFFKQFSNQGSLLLRILFGPGAALNLDVIPKIWAHHLIKVDKEFFFLVTYEITQTVFFDFKH